MQRITRTIDRASPRGWLRAFLRAFLRAPILLYRLHLGVLLGRRFLLLSHLGRRSGRWRSAVLEVVRYAPAGPRWYVASGWGEQAQWLQNVTANPAVTVMMGARSWPASARRLACDEAEREPADYAQRHPRAFRQLLRFMIGAGGSTSGDALRSLAARLPLVELQASAPCHLAAGCNSSAMAA